MSKFAVKRGGILLAGVGARPIPNAPALLATLKLLTNELAYRGYATRLVERARAEIAEAEGPCKHEFHGCCPDGKSYE